MHRTNHAHATRQDLHLPTPDSDPDPVPPPERDPDPLPPDGTPRPIGDPPNSHPPEHVD
jgi:hypothetical protein